MKGIESLFGIKQNQSLFPSILFTRNAFWNIKAAKIFQSASKMKTIFLLILLTIAVHSLSEGLFGQSIEQTSLGEKSYCIKENNCQPQIALLQKGAPLLIYMNVKYCNGTTASDCTFNNNGNPLTIFTTETATFFPKVDEYSFLSAKNSIYK